MKYQQPYLFSYLRPVVRYASVFHVVLDFEDKKARKKSLSKMSRKNYLQYLVKVFCINSFILSVDDLEKVTRHAVPLLVTLLIHLF